MDKKDLLKPNIGEGFEKSPPVDSGFEGGQNVGEAEKLPVEGESINGGKVEVDLPSETKTNGRPVNISPEALADLGLSKAEVDAVPKEDQAKLILNHLVNTKIETDAPNAGTDANELMDLANQISKE